MTVRARRVYEAPDAAELGQAVRVSGVQHMTVTTDLSGRLP